MLNFQHGHIHYTGLCIPNCRAKWTVPAGFQVIDLNCLIHALILFTACFGGYITEELPKKGRREDMYLRLHLKCASQNVFILNNMHNYGIALEF